MGKSKRTKVGRNIYKIERQKGTVYEVRYYGADNRQHGKTFNRKSDAKRFLVEQRSKVHSGEWIDPQKAKTPFRQVAEMWKDTWLDLKPTTVAKYEANLEVDLIPEFGNTHVSNITHDRVQRYVRKLNNSDNAAETTRTVFAVLRTCLSYAVRHGMIPSNPCQGVKLPKPNTREMLFLSAEQVASLAEAIDERYRVLIYFAAYTGMRASEIVGLKVGRLDLMRGTALVSEAVTDVGGELVTGDPKTKTSSRTLTLPTFLVEMLAEYLADRDTSPDAYVFTAPKGGPLRWTNFRNRRFNPAVREALPEHLHRLRPHDLRHTCASLLIAQGAHPKAIQERLGHSSIRVTLDRYSHLLPSLDEQLTDALDATYRDSLRATGTEGQVVPLRPTEQPEEDS